MVHAVIKAPPGTRQWLGNGNCHVDAASAQFIIGVDKMQTEMQQSMLVSLRHRMAREGEIGCYVGGQQREHSSSKTGKCYRCVGLGELPSSGVLQECLFLVARPA